MVESFKIVVSILHINQRNRFIFGCRLSPTHYTGNVKILTIRRRNSNEGESEDDQYNDGDQVKMMMIGLTRTRYSTKNIGIIIQKYLHINLLSYTL